jgi:hypothetical protein
VIYAGQFEISVAMAEVYCQEVRDLLDTDAVARRGARRVEPLENALRRAGVDPVGVGQTALATGDAVTDVAVHSAEEAAAVVRVGQVRLQLPQPHWVTRFGLLSLTRCLVSQRHRATAATAMNEQSSRSHLVVRLRLWPADGSGGSGESLLQLIDLAGSERINKSAVEGQRLKEATAVNVSLSALGDVIAALKGKSRHVPYRNSKLTYLLSDTLGGEAKCMMVATVSPAESSVAETLNTLTFAARWSPPPPAASPPPRASTAARPDRQTSASAPVDTAGLGSRNTALGKAEKKMLGGPATARVDSGRALKIDSGRQRPTSAR